jgi:IS5 family transposase
VTVNELLVQRDLLLKAGTAVDATLIAAPTSTKNKDQARDPEILSSKRGNQWYLGMKAHIGVDAESGLVHTVRGTSGHVSDIAEANSRPAFGPKFLTLFALSNLWRVRSKLTGLGA